MLQITLHIILYVGVGVRISDIPLLYIWNVRVLTTRLLDKEKKVGLIHHEDIHFVEFDKSRWNVMYILIEVFT